MFHGGGVFMPQCGNFHVPVAATEQRNLSSHSQESPQARAGHVASRGGKSGLSIKPIFPQPLCLSLITPLSEEPKAHASGACLLRNGIRGLSHGRHVAVCPCIMFGASCYHCFIPNWPLRQNTHKGTLFAPLQYNTHPVRHCQ